MELETDPHDETESAADEPVAAPTKVKKNFILDTNVLLHDPLALFQFDDNNVVIPIYVIEECDNFKKDASELGRNARQVSRYLDQFREDGAHLADGVPLPGGGQLSVAFTKKTLPRELRIESHHADNRILAVALEIKEKFPDQPTIFVTQDTNLRLRADAAGLRAENYERDSVKIDALYTGHSEMSVPGDVVDAFFDKGELELEDHPNPDGTPREVTPNECIMLSDAGRPGHTALGRVSLDGKTVNAVRRISDVWGLRPRNKEQTFALDMLLDDNVPLITLVGKAGTGKTLLAIAAGLVKVAEHRVHHRLLVSRPIFPLGRDIGYLPGTVEEKLNPWMQPIYDNVELLMGLTHGDRRDGRSYRELVDLGLIEIEPLTYIRGRSIPNQYIVVDEAQNLTPHEVKTIITRVGDGTKIVFTGDPYQIDNPYVDASTNGLTYIVNRFSKHSLAGHITLMKGERSELAELASNIL